MALQANIPFLGRAKEITSSTRESADRKTKQLYKIKNLMESMCDAGKQMK